MELKFFAYSYSGIRSPEHTLNWSHLVVSNIKQLFMLHYFEVELSHKTRCML